MLTMRSSYFSTLNGLALCSVCRNTAQCVLHAWHSEAAILGGVGHHVSSVTCSRLITTLKVRAFCIVSSRWLDWYHASATCSKTVPVRNGHGHRSRVDYPAVHACLPDQSFSKAQINWYKMPTAMPLKDLQTNSFAIRLIKFLAYVSLVLSLCWSIFSIVGGAVRCTPFSENWHIPFDNAHCFNARAYYAPIAVGGLLVDGTIWSIPIPVVWQLQLPRYHKVAITLIFCLGMMSVSGGLLR